MIRKCVVPLLALGLMLTSIGCKKEAAQQGTEPAAPKEEKKGLEAAGNDPAVVAEVKKILECEWKRFGFSSSKCEAFKAFNKSDMIKRGRADATMVNLLEDDDSKVRWLAARTLKMHGKTYEGDPKLAARVLTAAEQEKDEQVAVKMMGAVADMDLVGTKLADRAIALAKSHPVEEARAELVHSVLFKNRDSNELYEFVKATAKEAKEDKIRRAAVRAFWVGTPRDKTEEVCKLWLDVAQNDASDDVAGVAMRLAAQNPNARCEAQYDGLLELAESKAKEGKVKTSDVAFALRYIHGQKKASDAHKKRALSIAKILLENEANKDMARADALRLLGKEHPKGKAMAKKYKDAKSFFVKNAAKRILEGK